MPLAAPAGTRPPRGAVDAHTSHIVKIGCHEEHINFNDAAKTPSRSEEPGLAIATVRVQL